MSYVPHNKDGFERLTELQRAIFSPFLEDWRRVCRTMVGPSRAPTAYEIVVKEIGGVDAWRGGLPWQPFEDHFIREKQFIWTAKQMARTLRRDYGEVFRRLRTLETTLGAP